MKHILLSAFFVVAFGLMAEHSVANEASDRRIREELKLSLQQNNGICEKGSKASGFELLGPTGEPTIEVHWTSPIPKSESPWGWDAGFSGGDFGIAMFLCPQRTDVTSLPGQFDSSYSFARLTPNGCREIMSMEEIRSVSWEQGYSDPRNAVDSRSRRGWRAPPLAYSNDQVIWQTSHFRHQTMACTYGFTGMKDLGYLVITPIEADSKNGFERQYLDTVKGMAQIVSMAELRAKGHLEIHRDNGIKVILNYRVEAPPPQ